MSLLPRITVRRVAGLMTSLFLAGLTYVMFRTDRLFIRREYSWSLHARCLLLQHQLLLVGVPGWSPEGHACRQLNATELTLNATELLQNAAVKATKCPEPLENPKPAVEPPVPFDRVSRLRGYVGVPNGTKELSLRCRVCAVVSNSGQLLKYEAGNEIDQADCVIRMNDAPVLGFEKHVGNKTTLRVSCFQSVYLVPASGSLYDQAGKSALLGWGPPKDMDTRRGKAHRKLKLVSEMNRDLDVYMLTQERMGYSAKVYKDETGKSLEHPDDTTRYHYYVSKLKEVGPKLKECDFYKRHQRTPNGAHRFFTEKTIFARWAPHHNVTFHYPSWSP
ncbi:alpha-N-acetyl-neuraminyl-2,3-beta-galactosyl-1,3-N-acetyl-galactosaminide alpha-2,6-sialyltransferase-like isoform X2 [Branchiostoma lanceolatum]|uniref:alpha-N-acetyl-neuraminyl-2,3-beta-galactosyl-1, 3-N-acetyl-galactosaminide alpha-2,6-sialyltransferase-like isoform X2 n=1 Tax=Branchiostoma lanceolatum TaxID=7740 RepID=UPI003456EA66